MDIVVVIGGGALSLVVNLVVVAVMVGKYKEKVETNSTNIAEQKKSAEKFENRIASDISDISEKNQENRDRNTDQYNNLEKLIIKETISRDTAEKMINVSAKDIHYRIDREVAALKKE